MQLDANDWKYGCTHKAWPQNRFGDLVPIVQCGGDVGKCQIEPKRIKNMINGKRRKIANAMRKIVVIRHEIIELESLMYGG